MAGVDLAGADETARSELRLRQLGVVDQHAGRTLRPELDVRDNVALQMRVGRRTSPARRVPAPTTRSPARSRRAGRPFHRNAFWREAQRVAVVRGARPRPCRGAGG